MTAKNRIDRLTQSVEDELGGATIRVEPWREGVDFYADRLDRGAGPEVLRSPRYESIDTSYEGRVQFADVMKKEQAALRLMSTAGIPTSVPSHFHRATTDSDVSWQILDLVEHDEDEPIPLMELGQLTALLHEIQPDETDLRPQADWSGFAWDRISMRYNAATSYLELPPSAQLARLAQPLLADRQQFADRLLHLDLRQGNVCCRDGTIVAIIDAANCVVGDPLFEIARVRAYGLLTDEFEAGYGRVPSSGAEGALLDLYELDTTALLTVVAVEEIDDPDLHQRSAQRTRELVERLGLATPYGQKRA